MMKYRSVEVSLRTILYFCCLTSLGTFLISSTDIAYADNPISFESEKFMSTQQETELSFDIVINGGSFSSPASALQAARTNPEAKILLLEPTDWLGGQATSQGVSAIDNTWFNPGAYLMRNNPEIYYPEDYLSFLDQTNNPPAEAPGTGMAPNGTAWVSREAYDPRTAAWVLDRMVEAYPNITLMKLSVVKDVVTEAVSDEFGEGRKITELRIIQRTPQDGYEPFDKFLSEEILDWYTPVDSAIYTKAIYRVVPRDAEKGLVVIDASELADAIVLSGATYTVGRELTTEVIGEDGTLPDMDEDGSQSFVYPFCMSDAVEAASETEIKTPFPDFDTYYQEQKNTFFSLGSHTWDRVWTYRRLKLGIDGNFDINRGDVTMQNWYPGNDYPYGTMYLGKAAAEAQATDWYGGVIATELANAEKHAVAWYFYMKEFEGSGRTPQWDTHYLNGDDALNMMGSKTGLAKYPYIRGTRRIVGLSNFRLMERYFVDTAAADYPGGTSFRFYDSVGIGNYAADVHPTKISTGLSPSRHRPAPFYIPYRCLASVNVRNLLAGGKQIAGTFITNSAYRLHPIEWAIGSAAGTAAGLMAKENRTNYELMEIDTLRSLQNDVVQNSPISWEAFDSQPIPSQNGDLVVNNLDQVQGDVPFQVEIYHHSAVRAEVYQWGKKVGETTTRSNGRLLLADVTVAATGSEGFQAICYDSQGTQIDILGDIKDYNIVDNSDSRFEAVGEWSVASSQPDKYGVSYHYSWEYSEPSTATWNLTIPESGDYEVFIWYPESSNRSEYSPFTVHHVGGTTTIPVNQQVNGGQWNSLGIFSFDAETGGKVVLTNDISEAEKLVVADAVRIQPVGSTATWQVY